MVRPRARVVDALLSGSGGERERGGERGREVEREGERESGRERRGGGRAREMQRGLGGGVRDSDFAESAQGRYRVERCSEPEWWTRISLLNCKNKYHAETSSGSEKGAYFRLRDFGINQPWARE